MLSCGVAIALTRPGAGLFSHRLVGSIRLSSFNAQRCCPNEHLLSHWWDVGLPSLSAHVADSSSSSHAAVTSPPPPLIEWSAAPAMGDESAPRRLCVLWRRRPVQSMFCVQARSPRICRLNHRVSGHSRRRSCQHIFSGMRLASWPMPVHASSRMRWWGACAPPGRNTSVPAASAQEQLLDRPRQMEVGWAEAG